MINDPLEFGKQLIETGDLDPVYIALVSLPLKQRMRISVAYWCYYHLGVAAKISEAPDFWRQLADGLPCAPRGSERRHFRGAKAVTAIEGLKNTFPRGPEALIAYLTRPKRASKGREGVLQGRGCVGGGREGVSTPSGPTNALGASQRSVLPFEIVRRRVLTLPMFGIWIAFKIGDMLERVGGFPIDFTDYQLLQLYDEPRAGAEMAAEVWKKKVSSPEEALQELISQLEASGLRAPPDSQRFCNIQEAETILCKWKAHVRGSYEIGKDTLEIEHGLINYPSVTGDKLRLALEAQSPLLQKRKKRAIV